MVSRCPEAKRKGAINSQAECNSQRVGNKVKGIVRIRHHAETVRDFEQIHYCQGKSCYKWFLERGGDG